MSFPKRPRNDTNEDAETGGLAEESTEFKIALLASLCEVDDTDVLLDTLLAHQGNVESARLVLRGEDPPRKRRAISAATCHQASLPAFSIGVEAPVSGRLTKKGRTLHLYSPEDIAALTPCSIIHQFLPQEKANALLLELLAEAPTFGKETFKIFDNTVTSPHTMCFYVDDLEHADQQRKDFIYNGFSIEDVRRTTPVLQSVGRIVQIAVNQEIKKRILSHYPNQKKLKHQSPNEWVPNTSFVNCYNGGKESVGYHSDQLTYLGPRPVIGSLSLGVAREFRVRRIVPRIKNADPEDKISRKVDDERADVEGQISIHLPHNSLLVMHAEMQEEWKHCVAPQPTVIPHPLAQNKRINITYRHYRDSFNPKVTPRCKCEVPMVLRCIQKQQQSRGKYCWMCQSPSRCDYIEWAEFDEDGEPCWTKDDRRRQRSRKDDNSSKGYS